MELKFEEDEDEFRSCCADEEELDREGIIKQGVKNDGDDEDDVLDIHSVRMFFKGVSMADVRDTGFNVSGIGVVIEETDKIPIIQVQKKLDFFVDESVADYLALMDGITEASRNNIKRVFAFTDSTTLFDQITAKETFENPFLMALKQRILEHVENLEHFVLKCVPSIDLEEPLRLAQVAIGVVNVNLPINGDSSVQKCLICHEDKPTPMTITIKCSHKFCSFCIKDYVDEQLQSSQVPIKCPSVNCRYYISSPECKSFLLVVSYALLQDALLEPKMLATDKFYCPFSDCSVLLDPCCDSNQSDNNCVECPVCRRFICVKCGVPWHSSMSCDQFQHCPPRVHDDPVENRKWRRCQMCERMIESMHGCYHMSCWCGHEFCYSCGADYIDSEQTCRCMLSDTDAGGENDDFTLTQNYGSSSPAVEEWAWYSCGSLSNLMDAYSDQERSQLALIQRFLAGGFSLSDHHTCPSYQSQSPPPPCADSGSSYLENTMKDLHQLPWLERFVSVISDNYYEQYTE